MRSVYYAEAVADHKDHSRATAATEHLDKVYGVRRDMTEGTGSTGGFLTSTSHAGGILEVATESQCFLPRCQKVPLGTRELTFDALDQFRAPLAGMSATLAGVQVYRKTEAASRTQSQPYFRKVRLLANDQTAYAQLSRDLIMDANIDINAYVAGKFGTALGWKNEYEALNVGDGNGRMLSVLNSPATINVAEHVGDLEIPGLHVAPEAHVDARGRPSGTPTRTRWTPC